MITARGFAAVDHRGVILVDTVSWTERAAKVNWLVVYGRSFVSAAWDDDRINNEFRRQARGVASIEPVKIEEESA